MWMSHVTPMNESRHTYRVVARKWPSLVTHINKTCDTYEWSRYFGQLQVNKSLHMSETLHMSKWLQMSQTCAMTKCTCLSHCTCLRLVQWLWHVQLLAQDLDMCNYRHCDDDLDTCATSWHSHCHIYIVIHCHIYIYIYISWQKLHNDCVKKLHMCLDTVIVMSETGAMTYSHSTCLRHVQWLRHAHTHMSDTSASCKTRRLIHMWDVTQTQTYS